MHTGAHLKESSDTSREPKTGEYCINQEVEKTVFDMLIQAGPKMREAY